MGRRLVITLAVLLGAITGCIFALTSPRVAESLRVRAMNIARERFNVELGLEQLRVELLPPAVEIRGVTLADDDSTPPWLTAHRARLVVQPWPSPTGAVVIQDLEVDGLRADVTRFTDYEAKPSENEKLPIDVLNLHVWNARIRAKTGPLGDVAVDDLQLAMRQARGTMKNLILDIGALSVSPDGRPLHARLSAKASFHGTIDAPQRVTLSNFELSNPTVDIRGNGQARLLPLLDFTLHVDTVAELERALTLVPHAPRIGGQGRVQLDLAGGLTDISATVSADVRAVTLPGRPRAGFARGREPRVDLGDVSVLARYGGGRIDVESIAVDNPRAGKVQGSGSVTLSGSYPVQGKAQTAKASLPEILDMAGLPDAWVRLLFDGAVEATGTLKPFVIELQVDGRGDDLRVGDRSYRAGGSKTYLALDDIGLRGKARIDNHEVRLEGLGIGLRDAHYVTSGTLDFDPDVGIALDVASERAELDKLGPIAGLTLGGQGPMQAKLAGPYRNPTITASCDITGLMVAGYAIGDAKGQLQFKHPQLSFDDVTVKRHEGTAHGNGVIDFGGRDPTAKADLTVEHLDLTSALTDVGVPPKVASRVGARVNGEVAIDGALGTPAGTAKLRSSAFAIDGVEMGAAEFEGGFDATPWVPEQGKAGELAWGRIVMQPRGGKADGRAAYRKDGTLALAGNVAQIPAKLVSPFVGNIPMTGSVSGSLRLEGTKQTLTGNASARLRDWTVYDARLETSQVDATFEPGRVLMTANLLSGDADGKGLLMLDEHGTYEATFSGKRIDFDRLLPVTGPVTIIFDGDMHARGRLTDPQSLTAEVVMPKAEARWREIAMVNVEPVAMRYDHETLHVNKMKLAGSGLSLEVSGDAPLHGELAVRAKGGGSLHAARLLSPRIQSAEGKLTLDLVTRGTWQNMELDGNASVRDGELRAANSHQTLEDVTADVSFSGRTLTLDSAQAKVGGGTLKLDGQAVLANGDASEVSIRAELARITLTPMTDLSTTLSGSLSLQGPMADLLLSGHIKIDQLRYTQNIELVSFIPEQTTRPLAVPAIESSEVVRLAVGVSAPNNIVVSNNVLEAELRADLTVTGTSNRVGLMGSVTPLWARARYRNNVFNVERASIDFTDEYRLFTQFDIRATTKACGIDARVSVFGDTEAYNVSASGSDLKGIVDPQDVLACLQFGIRLRQFEGHEAAGATTTLRDTYAGGLDALWTVSGMDEKVRRVLPIELDEVRLTSGWSSRARRTTARILVGKDIGRNVAVRYSRSIEDDQDHNVALEYRLSNVATVQGTWLSVTDAPIADFGLDLRLRWEFR